MSSLSFAHLNLRRNPFGELTHDESAHVAIVDLETTVQHLKNDARRPVVQFVGDKGFGKTTHLLALFRRFPESSYMHIREGEVGRIPNHGDPLLIDEAQRLTWFQRRQLFRSNRRLILGTHCDFHDLLDRMGRHVLTLAADRNTDSVGIHSIMNRRIEAARRSDGPTPSVTEATSNQLFMQFGSDLRSIQNSLYETFQRLRSIQDV